MKKINGYIFPIIALVLSAASCSEEIDNFFSRNNSEIQLTPSGEYIKLDENNPDDTALTLDWSSAHDYGDDYITSYKYQMQLIGSSFNEIEEYEDDGNFHRSYTNKQLQDILTGHFGLTTSTVGSVLFTVTASFEGPRTVVPDIATAVLNIKTYGAKQFKADKLYMAGTAVGDQQVELIRSATDTMVYTYNGRLMAGTINFPVINFDETNAIGPSAANETVTQKEMDAIITDKSDAFFWMVPADDTYRVTVNLRTHTVKIVAAGATVELSSMFMAGTAVGESQIQVEQTLEDENLYAWRGPLNAGTLYLPFTNNGTQEMAIVPQQAGSHDIEDGQSQTFGQASAASAPTSRYWSVPAAGTYRIVVNIEEKTIAIYSAATDLKSKTVTWNNTTLQVNPYTTVVDTLYMYGTFNGFAHDPGVFTGYQAKYNLKQSTANPNVFVYKGEDLPLGTANDERGNSVTGSVKFTVNNMNNNVYAYGSTASAKRNDHNGYITASLGESQGLVAGQSDNRYAYFFIPVGCNFVKVDIDKLTVVFDKK